MKIASRVCGLLGILGMFFCASCLDSDGYLSIKFLVGVMVSIGLVFTGAYLDKELWEDEDFKF